MKRIFGLLLVVLLAVDLSGCASLLSQQKEEHAQVVNHVRASTVALVASVDDKVHVFCSGVWVDSDSILTANHCMQGLADIQSRQQKTLIAPMGVKVHYVLENEVQNVGEEPTGIHLGTAVFLDSKHDLALIHADGNAIPKHGIIKLAPKTPPVSDRLYIVGHQTGLYFTFMEGVAAAYRKNFDEIGVDISGPFLQIQSDVFFGNSGGGAFNTDGELVGIASFLMRAPGMSYFIHVETIRTFLKDAKVIS